MSCIIDDVCYGEDETNAYNADEVCKPLESEYEWTLGEYLDLKICFAVWCMCLNMEHCLNCFTLSILCSWDFFL